MLKKKLECKEVRMVTKVVQYQTADGKFFDKVEDANKWEQRNLENCKYFKGKCYPDLNEGRYPPNTDVFIQVRAKDSHFMFAKYAMYKVFGNEVAFVQGVFGSNAITPNWSLSSACDVSEVDFINSKLIVVEEQFIETVDGTGIHVDGVLLK